jgi:murein DD-endopeptidase MepM/ murein hydrolase activator NlpD
MKTLLALVWLSATLGATAPAQAPTSVLSSGAARVAATGGLATALTAEVVPTGDYRWPISPTPPLIRPFQAPPQPWAAGHRGVDLLGGAGTPVLAAAPGTVTHSGVIAGRGTVTVTHRDGRRTTYEPLDDRSPVGAAVAAGDRIGSLATGGSHCAPRICLHWGLLVGPRDYRDPLTLFGSTRVRLLPLP